MLGTPTAHMRAPVQVLATSFPTQLSANGYPEKAAWVYIFICHLLSKIYYRTKNPGTSQNTYFFFFISNTFSLLVYKYQWKEWEVRGLRKAWYIVLSKRPEATVVVETCKCAFNSLKWVHLTPRTWSQDVICEKAFLEIFFTISLSFHSSPLLGSYALFPYQRWVNDPNHADYSTPFPFL